MRAPPGPAARSRTLPAKPGSRPSDVRKQRGEDACKSEPLCSWPAARRHNSQRATLSVSGGSFHVTKCVPPAGRKPAGVKHLPSHPGYPALASASVRRDKVPISLYDRRHRIGPVAGGDSSAVTRRRPRCILVRQVAAGFVRGEPNDVRVFARYVCPDAHSLSFHRNTVGATPSTSRSKIVPPPACGTVGGHHDDTSLAACRRQQPLAPSRASIRTRLFGTCPTRPAATSCKSP
jgi:hypothetical protein